MIKDKILTFPDSHILRYKSLPIDHPQLVDLDVSHLVERMKKIVKEYNGVGLSAVQLGVAVRLCVIDTEEIKRVMINPSIEMKIGRQKSHEGCLSLPGISKIIDRHRYIIVRYRNLEGNEIQEEFTGILAAVIQHEIDHMNGKLIIDY